MRRLVGERLPALTLPAAAGEGQVRLRPRGRDASVLLLLPSASPSGAPRSRKPGEPHAHESTDAPRSEERSDNPSDLRAYVAALTASVPEMRRWDGRLLLVADGGPRAFERFAEPSGSEPLNRNWPPGHGRSGLAHLVDERRTLRCRLALEEAGTVLFIADRWGEIYHAARLGDAALPSPAAIIEWLKYLTTQCPECGVIDAPGYGAWAPE